MGSEGFEFDFDGTSEGMRAAVSTKDPESIFGAGQVVTVEGSGVRASYFDRNFKI